MIMGIYIYLIQKKKWVYTYMFNYIKINIMTEIIYLFNNELH